MVLEVIVGVNVSQQSQIVSGFVWINVKQGIYYKKRESRVWEDKFVEEGYGVGVDKIEDVVFILLFEFMQGFGKIGLFYYLGEMFKYFDLMMFEFEVEVGIVGCWIVGFYVDVFVLLLSKGEVLLYCWWYLGQ